MKDSKKPLSSYTDPEDPRRIMANAEKRGRQDISREAFRALCALEGKNYNDPLERDFYAMLAAYEELLAQKHGHRSPAHYTRRKLKNRGVEGCLEDWALDKKLTDGFKTLVANGLVELTGEFLVVKYPDRFSKEAVANARARLARQSGNLAAQD